MIKKHTAQSLGKYFGQKIRLDKKANIEEVYERHLIKPTKILKNKKKIKDDLFLVSINSRWVMLLKIAPNANLEIPVDASLCYPALKDYTQLEKPMLHNEEEIVPLKYIYNETADSEDVNERFQTLTENYDISYPGPKRIEKLIELGFGAIENKESPTGYVDLFDYPCVLDK